MNALQRAIRDQRRYEDYRARPWQPRLLDLRTLTKMSPAQLRSVLKALRALDRVALANNQPWNVLVRWRRRIARVQGELERRKP